MTKSIKTLQKHVSHATKINTIGTVPNPELQPTLIPSYPTDILHIDVMEYKRKKKYITCTTYIFSPLLKLF